MSPGDGATRPRGVTEFRALLAPVAGRPPDEATALEADVTAPDGGHLALTLPRTAGGFIATLNLDDGHWRADVRRGALSATQQFDIGPLPPTFEVALAAPAPAPPSTGDVQHTDPGQPGSYRRDEKVLLRARVATGDGQPGTLAVALTVAAERHVLPAATCPATLPCVEATCQCFEADLAAPTLLAFRGVFGLEVSGQSLSGQQVTESTASAPQRIPGVAVSRWVFRRRYFTPAPTGILEAPFIALDGRGRAIVGQRQEGVATVASITSTGQVQWQRAIWAMSPPVVGQWPDAGEVVHLAQFFTAFETAETDGGVRVNAPVAPFPTAVWPEFSLFPGQDGGGELVLGMSYPGSLGQDQPFSYGPGHFALASNRSNGSVGAMSADGETLYWGTEVFGNGDCELHTSTFASGGYPSGLWASVDPARCTHQLVPVPGGVVGAEKYDGRSSWFRWSPADGGFDWRFPATGGYAGRDFLMPTPTEIIGIRFTNPQGNMELVRVQVGATAPSATLPITTQSIGGGVLGAGGALFLTETIGKITQHDATTLRPVWSVTLSNDRFDAPLQLDCARDDTGAAVPGRPGRLVAVGRAGNVYSFVVDTPGLDTAAWWPSRRRDPANTNNSATDLTRFACP